MEKKYFDELISSLEDAAAFAKGDSSRARAVEVKASEPIHAYRAGDRGINENSRGMGGGKE